MSARAIASATISFGLVSIPVKLYSAANPSSGVHFNLMHKKCGTRLKQQYICPKDEEKVTREEMAKGFEFAKGQYVLFSPQELKNLEEKATQALEITEFLPLEKIDTVYYSKAYYLGPDKGGDRAYKLLSKALDKSGRAALAKYAARGKQYLVMIRPFKDGLLMQQLHYADEIRSIGEVPLGDADVKNTELKLAMQIIDQGISEVFKPDDYTDEVRARMLEAIEKKVDGHEITAAPEQPQAQVIDLMEALRSSLSSGSRREAKAAPTSAKKKTARKTAKKSKKRARS